VDARSLPSCCLLLHQPEVSHHQQLLHPLDQCAANSSAAANCQGSHLHMLATAPARGLQPCIVAGSTAVLSWIGAANIPRSTRPCCFPPTQPPHGSPGVRHIDRAATGVSECAGDMAAAYISFLPAVSVCRLGLRAESEGEEGKVTCAEPATKYVFCCMAKAEDHHVVPCMMYTLLQCLKCAVSQ
jgi:hypothetical protein